MKTNLRLLWTIIFASFLAVIGGGSTVQAGTHPKDLSDIQGETITHELWLGIYMEGVKVGYSRITHTFFSKDGKDFRKSSNESWVKVSRLGGGAVEIKTVQESLFDASGRPLDTVMRMNMSESETVIRAEMTPKKVLFKLGSRVIKEVPYEGDVFLEVPLETIFRDEGLKPGRRFVFQVLDPFSYGICEARVEIVGEEEVLILGEQKRLWHVRTETDYLIPMVADEWVDQAGQIWKSDSQTGFLSTTSIRMPKDRALEVSEENFDIAFSTIIKPDTTIERPREVRTARFKLTGVSPEKIRALPFDDGSQNLLEIEENQAVIQTNSQVFLEENSLSLPIVEKKVLKYLEPTYFCQSDDPEIVGLAQDIIGQESNAWRAVKRIAEWVSQEMRANYDVGFASAREIFNNREGDCSEYTGITVALCRAAGIPARSALGIMYGQGLFAYHMWPEVFVGRWINLDAKWLAVEGQSGEYYTDATHIKLGRSSLDENIFKEMAQAISKILGKLNIEVIDYSHEK